MDELTISAPVLFISDVHLGGFSHSENARIESELIQLIQYCRNSEIQIVVLGDLFDYWMEFPGHVPSLGRSLLDRFEAYNREWGATLYITGNHDYWTRGHLAGRGFHIISEYIKLSVDEKKIMLLHGDGLADASFDLRRPLLHRLLRHSDFITWYQRLLSPPLGLWIMKYFSRFNRWMDRHQNHEATLSGWARQQLRYSELDLIIAGHDHVPRRKQFSFGRYINIGTFYKHRTMAFYNNRRAELVYWQPGTQSLQPFDSANTIEDE